MQPSSENLSITQFDFLSESECSNVVSTLFELKEFWIQRHVFPFYTMGVASYLDATSLAAREAYTCDAQLYNPILMEHFDWLYERLAAQLAGTLQHPVRYQSRFALPGFHIFLSSLGFAKPGGSVHLDLQYSLLDWEGANADFSNPISFTLCLALPTSGGGLHFWDLQKDEWLGCTPEEQETLTRERSKRFYPYSVGRLVVHSGHHVHQIAPMVHPKKDDKRITLQGHGILCEGMIQIYW